MLNYSTQQLAKIMNAQLIGNSSQNIHSIYIDSRNIIQGQNGIFFALKGAQIDGSLFLQDAYNKGVRCFVLTRLPEIIYEDSQYLLVENTLVALQKWAAYHRDQFLYSVVGITGSNGKTIVKEWLYQLLFQKLKLIRSPKSYNSQIGVALSLLEMEPNLDLDLVELGISQPGEMEVIAQMVHPNMAVLTNVGSAHSEFFEDRNQQIQEKINLFEFAETLIYSADDLEVIEAVTHRFSVKNNITFGESNLAKVQLLSGYKSSQMEILSQNQIYKFDLPFSDSASISNALICFAILSQLPVNLEEISADFSKLQAVEMRLEIKEGNQDTVIINDAFNADLSSVPIALNVLNQQAKELKTLVLTDILQNRISGEELYQQVADWVNAYPIQKVILIGDEITKFQSKFNKVEAIFANTSEFLDQYNAPDFAGEAILLKGARKFELEKISKKFEKKSHDTILEVNLQNLQENVNYFRSKLRPQTRLMGMVKAFGYGTGGFEIAQALSNYNIDYLGVAYADEGAELRQKGIKTPIMVMNPEQSSYDTIIDFGLEAEIYSLRVLEKFTLKLIEKKIQMAFPIHIKLNTGMNRLGFKTKEISELVKQLADNPYVRVISIFSHLATSDVPGEEDFVRQQVASYEEMYHKIAFNLGFEPIKHILATNGILRFPEYQMDMVRLGIGMYGISVPAESKKHLKNVVTFKTVISQIANLEIGETVSYGRHFVAKRPTKIATLPVGYADGIKRILGNENGSVNIHNQLAPIVGTVCMDMIMVDVTDIDCNEGDEVIVFGENPTIETVAKQCNTITYEILTSISSRVKRVYLRE